MIGPMVDWPRRGKQLAVVAMDVVLAVLATWLAFSLRLDLVHWPFGAQWYAYAAPPLLMVPVFIRLGLYRAIFRYTGLAALLAIIKAVLIYGAMLVALLAWQRWPDVPRSIGVLQPIIFLLLVGGSRALARYWLAGVGRVARDAQAKLLIYGAGEAGVQTAAGIGNARQFRLVGFVDDDPSKVGRTINGAPVYAAKDLPSLIAAKQVSDVLLALPSASRRRRNEIIASLHGVPVHVRTVPGLSDLASGRVSIQSFVELDIEDLLGRDPVQVDRDGLAGQIAGRVVLVTGAGGSIGSELCRQLAELRPVRLVLLDHSEYGLYNIHQELQGLCKARGLPIDLVPVLGSIGNLRRLREVVERVRPDWLYHAAAYKHVPIVEGNVGEGVDNNVFGTLNVARVAVEAGVARFVLVSTDKAVRPTNVMGATKRMAELVLQAFAADAQGRGTCFAMVRFGNVLGSSGSVVPLFRAQIASGGPLTVTHPEVTRYFMTIPEAAQLVLQAGAMARGGEVFVLDMGEPVRILQLARNMIELSGLSVRDAEHPDGDIEIAITGLRPGEKLYEELLIGDNPLATGHPRIMMAREAHLPWSELEPQLRLLRDAVDRGDVAAIQSVLSQCVQGYVQAPESGLMALS